MKTNFWNDIGAQIQQSRDLASEMTLEQRRQVDEIMERVRMGKSGYFEEIAKLVIALTKSRP